MDKEVRDKIVIYNPCFFTCLEKKGYVNDETVEITPTFFDFNLHVFPIHIDSSCPHWVLGLVEVLEEEDDTVQCSISVIDSANYAKYCSNHLKILEFFFRSKISQYFSGRDLKINVGIRIVNQFKIRQFQSNGYDCGPFTTFHFHNFLLHSKGHRSEIPLPLIKGDTSSIGPYYRKMHFDPNFRKFLNPVEPVKKLSVIYKHKFVPGKSVLIDLEMYDIEADLINEEISRRKDKCEKKCSELNGAAADDGYVSE